MLSDEETYRKLERDPTPQYEEEFKVLDETGYQTRVLSIKEKRYLVQSSSRIPTIYTLPIIHKDINHPPARPIVNGIGSITSWMGQYLDQFLQKSVTQTKAYLRDTKNLLQLLQDIDLTGEKCFWSLRMFCPSTQSFNMKILYWPLIGHCVRGTTFCMTRRSFYGTPWTSVYAIIIFGIMTLFSPRKGAWPWGQNLHQV